MPTAQGTVTNTDTCQASYSHPCNVSRVRSPQTISSIVFQYASTLNETISSLVTGFWHPVNRTWSSSGDRTRKGITEPQQIRQEIDEHTENVKAISISALISQLFLVCYRRCTRRKTKTLPHFWPPQYWPWSYVHLTTCGSLQWHNGTQDVLETSIPSQP